MYQKIYVPVDNSDYSNRAIRCAVSMGRAFGSRLVGSHVYAARMHDYRFKQMEYTLPEEYLQENELERQRKIHDSLITLGLKLISDSYLDQMDTACKEAGLELERKMMDGKHHVEIVKDIQESDYDLVVLGALGVGKVRDSQIGSVCERVTRIADRDVWVVKHVPKADEVESDTILVGIDGSPQSFGALMTAIEVARKFGKNIELIGVYDPYLHYAVFNGIVDVLSERASKVFRFEEQNQLHEEIIDTGLAQIYQSHLNVAESMARARGVTVKKTLLDGKAFQKILDHIRKTKPWLLVIGRIGVHSAPDTQGLGSNTENLLRLCPCDVLLSTRLEHPELDIKAEESILWTDEAKERMTRVPEMVRGIARTGILRLAIEKGHSVITNVVIDEAMDRFMPKRAAKATDKLAESLAFQLALTQPTSICRKCGVTAAEPDPIRCSVCSGTDFEVISPELIHKLASSEGGVEEETTYDGRKLSWTKEARDELRAIKDTYQKRRTKARIEKSARVRRLDTVTWEFARRIIDEEEGRVSTLEPRPVASSSDVEVSPAPASKAVEAARPADDQVNELRILSVDAKGNPFLSTLSWTEDALQRILRVPSGFMRNRTQERIESIAKERGQVLVDLAMVEDGIEIGRQMMAEMLKKAEDAKQPVATATTHTNGGPTDNSVAATPSAQASSDGCPVPHAMATPAAEPQVASEPVSHVYEGVVERVLNEVGLISEMDRIRGAMAAGEQPE